MWSSSFCWRMQPGVVCCWNLLRLVIFAVVSDVNHSNRLNFRYGYRLIYEVLSLLWNTFLFYCLEICGQVCRPRWGSGTPSGILQDSCGSNVFGTQSSVRPFSIGLGLHLSIGLVISTMEGATPSSCHFRIWKFLFLIQALSSMISGASLWATLQPSQELFFWSVSCTIFWFLTFISTPKRAHRCSS